MALVANDGDDDLEILLNNNHGVPVSDQAIPDDTRAPRSGDDASPAALPIPAGASKVLTRRESTGGGGPARGDGVSKIAAFAFGRYVLSSPSAVDATTLVDYEPPIVTQALDEPSGGVTPSRPTREPPAEAEEPRTVAKPTAKSKSKSDHTAGQRSTKVLPTGGKKCPVTIDAFFAQFRASSAAATSTTGSNSPPAAEEKKGLA